MNCPSSGYETIYIISSGTVKNLVQSLNPTNESQILRWQRESRSTFSPKGFFLRIVGTTGDWHFLTTRWRSGSSMLGSPKHGVLRQICSSPPVCERTARNVLPGKSLKVFALPTGFLGENRLRERRAMCSKFVVADLLAAAVFSAVRPSFDAMDSVALAEAVAWPMVFVTSPLFSCLAVTVVFGHEEVLALFAE